MLTLFDRFARRVALTLTGALVGTGLQDRICLRPAGEMATGGDTVKRLIHGVDFPMGVRSMKMEAIWIKAQFCHISRGPVGVPTAGPALAPTASVGSRRFRGLTRTATRSPAATARASHVKTQYFRCPAR